MSASVSKHGSVPSASQQTKLIFLPQGSFCKWQFVKRPSATATGGPRSRADCLYKFTPVSFSPLSCHLRTFWRRRPFEFKPFAKAYTLRSRPLMKKTSFRLKKKKIEKNNNWGYLYFCRFFVCCLCFLKLLLLLVVVVVVVVVFAVGGFCLFAHYFRYNCSDVFYVVIFITVAGNTYFCSLLPLQLSTLILARYFHCSKSSPYILTALVWAVFCVGLDCVSPLR